MKAEERLASLPFWYVYLIRKRWYYQSAHRL